MTAPMQRYMLWRVSDSDAIRMISRDTGEWVRHTDALAFAAQEYDRALEDAAAKLHWMWDADGTVTERRVAEESAAAIRALKKGGTNG